MAIKANPHFERIGGEAVVRRLVDAFYLAMDTRPDAATIRAMHEPDLSQTKAVLVNYLCEWLGGPKRYSETRGQPRLRRTHQPFAIDDSARAAWMACMQQAMQQCCDDAELRSELLAAFAKIALHVRNA